MYYAFSHENNHVTVHPIHLSGWQDNDPDAPALIVVRDKRTAEQVRRWSWRQFKTKLSRNSLGEAIPGGFADGSPVFEVQGVTSDGLLFGVYVRS